MTTTNDLPSKKLPSRLPNRKKILRKNIIGGCDGKFISKLGKKGRRNIKKFSFRKKNKQ